MDASDTFRVDRVDSDEGWQESYTWMGDPARLFRLKVTEGGGGECEGGLELISADGKEIWNMKPNQTGTAINGFGDYTLYLDAQR